MLVKICGITRLADAEAAIECGATALGFVFWRDSPRFIDPYRARAIARRVPAFVTTVGVFVNQAAAEVNLVSKTVGLGAVQLHGDETVRYATEIRQPIVKAVPVDSATREEDITEWPVHVTLLLDVRDPSLRGGTGRTVDWARAAAVAARPRSLLAGGLRPENVTAAIARVRPYGIDVSSGVESAPGVKDLGRLKALFDAVAAGSAQ
jgi:phosphoribosylanthranilate isomerase